MTAGSMKILYDCDNTMGIPNRDVDDALALIYLLGRPDVDLLGITATYGNDTVENTFNTTGELLRDLGREDVPLFRGGTAEKRTGGASRFLAEKAAEFRGDAVMLATGSLTNLYGAWQEDREFFLNLKRIVLMGGITEPLIIHGVRCNELNFSCDPEASRMVLSSGADLTVITGHLCLQAPFGRVQFDTMRRESANPLFRYLLERITPWRDLMEKVFHIDGFYNWDAVAAVCATDPGLFEDDYRLIDSGIEELATGALRISESDGYRVNIPKAIKDIGRLNRLLFSSWRKVPLVRQENCGD